MNNPSSENVARGMIERHDQDGKRGDVAMLSRVSKRKPRRQRRSTR